MSHYLRNLQLLVSIHLKLMDMIFSLLLGHQGPQPLIEIVSRGFAARAGNPKDSYRYQFLP